MIGRDNAGALVTLSPDVLTTHGVILGMTGSGKTGLAVVMLEELARASVPLLVCDLKGDLSNLLLQCPGATAGEFLRYLPPGPGDQQAEAEATAARWRSGLAEWGLGADAYRELGAGVDWRILTPGSGVAPVNLLPALDAPPGYDPDGDVDGSRSQLDGVTSGLLALAGRGGDPLSDRDHVLVSTVLDLAWRRGRRLDLPGLLRDLLDPPVSTVGVLDTDTFYPRKGRVALVGALNLVLASPAFAAWTRGVPLDMSEFLGPPGKPRATVFYLSHLTERERMSFLTLLSASYLAWARSQAGTGSLRSLLYIDEVQGILPPTAMPPTKRPLLTLIKQGRAFGAGVLLATQNPADLDYKALGNIGLKVVGRLDTENDRKHALQGLDLDDSRLSATVAQLGPRRFLLAGARAGEPRVMGSRWALSYLRGPLTLTEVKPLAARNPSPPGATSRPRGAPLLPGIRQFYGQGAELFPALLVEGRAVYRKASPKVWHDVDGFWLVPLDAGGVRWDRLRPVAGSPTLSQDPPAGAILAALRGDTADKLRTADRDFRKALAAHPRELLWQREYKMVQGEDETAADFRARCVVAAAEIREEKERDVSRHYEAKLRALEAKVERHEIAADRGRDDLDDRREQAAAAVNFGALGLVTAGLGAIFGARRSGFGAAARRVGSGSRMLAGAQVERVYRRVADAERGIEAAREDGIRAAAELALLGREIAAEEARGPEQIERLAVAPAARDISVRSIVLAWLPAETIAG